MTMTFLDRQVTSAYQEAQKATQIPHEYQRLTALMECAAAGNEHCFEALYDALVPRLYALINRILHNRTHAEEVTQEVFLEIWQKAPLYRAERGTVLSWAATIAHRRAVDRVRSVAASTERDFTRGLEEYRESYHHVDDAIAAFMDTEEIHHALSGIPREQAQLLTMAYFGGKSQREISDETGIPLGTVKTRMRAGMQKLRERLEGTREH